MELQPFAKDTILYQLNSNLVWVIRLGRLPALPNLVRAVSMSGRDATRGATYPLTFFSFLFFLFFNRATAYTREPIFAHVSSKDVVWSKEDPFWG